MAHRVGEGAGGVEPRQVSGPPVGLGAGEDRLARAAEVQPLAEEPGAELLGIGGTPAVVERLGQGCGRPQPELDVSDPVIGGTFVVRGSSAPATGPRLLVLGAPAGPITLPGAVLPGCAV